MNQPTRATALDDLEPGQVWAYKARTHEQVARVEVLRVGSAKPARVRIRFLDEDFEGREDWVPPSRLKVLWDNIGTWQEREDRWSAAIDASCHIRDEPEEHAAIMVFEKVIDREVAHFGYNRTAGIVLIRDLPALATMLAWPECELTSQPLTFTDNDGVIIAPWDTMLKVATRAAELNADTLLRYVAKSEDEDRNEAIYGKTYGRGKDSWYVPPEICADTAERHRPIHDLIRQWCGEPAQERLDELTALRAEVARLGCLVETAIAELRRANAEAAAARLESDLGVPIPTLRHMVESAGQA